MKSKKSIHFYTRLAHRSLGYFLAGIMAVYSVSGILLIYRKTDFLKINTLTEKKLEPEIKIEELGKKLKIKNFKVTRTRNDTIYFDKGTYNKITGVAVIKSKKLPYVLKKLTKFHKASTNEPLYWLNTFFGVALIFFVVSAFWMYLPKTKIFRKGLYYTAAGIIFALILLFI